MECVLADEAVDMGTEFGEYDDCRFAVLVSLFGDIDPSDPITENPLDFAATEADAEIPSPS